MIQEKKWQIVIQFIKWEFLSVQILYFFSIGHILKETNGQQWRLLKNDLSKILVSVFCSIEEQIYDKTWFQLKSTMSV